MEPPLPPLPALFLFAHHDDELFIAATMRRLAARRGEVLAVWLTRGGLHGTRREAESRRAMELIGVRAERLFFFRLPDCGVLDHLGEVVDRLARLLERHRPASLFVPACEGGHIDHDAAHLAAVAAVSRTGEERIGLYEFPLYHRAGARLLSVGEFIPGPTRELRTPLKLKDRLFKRRVARVFNSQRLVNGPLLALKGGPLMLHVRGEPYRPVPPDRDYTRPPHAGRLAYEFYTARRFEEFAKEARLQLFPGKDL